MIFKFPRQKTKKLIHRNTLSKLAEHKFFEERCLTKILTAFYIPTNVGSLFQV